MAILKKNREYIWVRKYYLWVEIDVAELEYDK